MVDHVVCVVANHPTVVYLARDLTVDMWRRRRRRRRGLHIDASLGFMLMEVLVIVLVVIVVVILVLGGGGGGGDGWRPVWVPVDIAEVAGMPIWAQLPPRKVSKFGDAMAKAGSCRRAIGRRACHRRISCTCFGPSRRTDRIGMQRLFRCHRASRFMSDHGTGWPHT
jgi:hypothetical protein